MSTLVNLNNLSTLALIKRITELEAQLADVRKDVWRLIETAPKQDDIQILTFHADFSPKNGRNKLHLTTQKIPNTVRHWG